MVGAFHLREQSLSGSRRIRHDETEPSLVGAEERHLRAVRGPPRVKSARAGSAKDPGTTTRTVQDFEIRRCAPGTTRIRLRVQDAPSVGTRTDISNRGQTVQIGRDESGTLRRGATRPNDDTQADSE